MADRNINTLTGIKITDLDSVTANYIRTGDILHGIVDPYTGEPVTLSLVSVNASGDPISDEDVDGVIYIKVGTEYFKRNIAGPINIKWFDVTGDGVTDDSTNVQTALDVLAAIGGGDLYFPTGNYFLGLGVELIKTSVTNYDNIRLLGDGGSKSRLFATDDQTDTTLTHLITIKSTISSKIKNVTVDGLYLDGQAETQLGGTGGGGLYHGGIWISNAEDCVIKNTTIVNAGTQAIYAGRNGGDNTTGCDNLTIAYNTIRDCHADGIYGQINHSCKYIGNHVENTGDSLEHYSIFCEGIYETLIANNTVRDCKQGIMANNSSTDRLSNSTIEGNNVYNVEGYGVYVAGSYGVNVTGNTLTFCLESGILVFRAVEASPVQNPFNTIANNSIYGAGKAGIAIGDNFNFVHGNHVINSNYNDDYTTGMYTSAYIIFYEGSYNIFRDNTAFNVYNNEDGQLNGGMKYGVWIDTDCVENNLADTFIPAHGVNGVPEVYHDLGTDTILGGGGGSTEILTLGAGTPGELQIGYDDGTNVHIRTRADNRNLSLTAHGTGKVFAPTPSLSENSEAIATTEFVHDIVGVSQTGAATRSGDSAATSFTIAHGLSGTPSVYFVQAASAAAKNISYVTADATNLTVNYDTAPPTGTNNINLNWEAKI